MNNNNNNIPSNKKDAGTDYDLSKISNNNINNEINLNNNIINFENNNNNINNLNQGSFKFEINEEFENSEESQSNNNINSSYNSNLINRIVPVENFSQQVDFLFHPKNPEWQTENIPYKNNTYNNTKILLPKQEKKLNLKNNNKIKKKKSKSKNKFRDKVDKNKYNKKKLENRPEFDLCTKIEPKPKKYNLSFFYGTKSDSKYETI